MRGAKFDLDVGIMTCGCEKVIIMNDVLDL